MNKQQIKTELRRSACEDKDPWIKSKIWAAEEAVHYCKCDEYVDALQKSDCRTFFLLVAEAL